MHLRVKKPREKERTGKSNEDNYGEGTVHERSKVIEAFKQKAPIGAENQCL